MWCMREAAQLEDIRHVCRTARQPARYKDIINYEGHSITRIIFGTKMYSVILFTLFMLQLLVFISFPFYVIFKTFVRPFFFLKEVFFFWVALHSKPKSKPLWILKHDLLLTSKLFSFLFFPITIINIRFGGKFLIYSEGLPYICLFYLHALYSFITFILKWSSILFLRLFRLSKIQALVTHLCLPAWSYIRPSWGGIAGVWSLL